MRAWAIHSGNMLLNLEYEHTVILQTSQGLTPLGHPQICIRLPTRPGYIRPGKSISSLLFAFDTHYILCYYNLVFEFLCHPEMGVWAIHPGHMLFKLENRVIIMPFFTAL